MLTPLHFPQPLKIINQDKKVAKKGEVIKVSPALVWDLNLETNEEHVEQWKPAPQSSYGFEHGIEHRKEEKDE